MNTVQTAVRFNDCINRRDLSGLSEMMTEDHIFTDNCGRQIIGREANTANWRKFFVLFPDYKNVFEHVSADGETITSTGYSLCSDARLNKVKAVWTAKIKGSKVEQWTVKHL